MTDSGSGEQEHSNPSGLSAHSDETGPSMKVTGSGKADQLESAVVQTEAHPIYETVNAPVPADVTNQPTAETGGPSDHSLPASIRELLAAHKDAEMGADWADSAVATENSAPPIGADQNAAETTSATATMVAPPQDGDARGEAKWPAKPTRIPKPVLAAAAIAGILLAIIPFALNSVGRHPNRGGTGNSVAAYSNGGGSTLGLVPSAEPGIPMAPTSSSGLSATPPGTSALTPTRNPASPPALAPVPASAGTQTRNPVPPPALPASAATAAQAPAPLPAAPRTTVAQATHTISGYGGKCVDVAGRMTANGTQIQLYTCDGTPAQSWSLSPNTPTTITALGKCMDVSGGGTTDGTRVQLYDCNGSGAQQWIYSSGHDLVNLQANKCLDATGPSSADGTPLQIWDCHGGPNQKWTLS